MTTKTNKTWIVVLETGRYVGEIDGIRQGVCSLENATRFTKRGAMRVCNATAAATHIQQVAS